MKSSGRRRERRNYQGEEGKLSYPGLKISGSFQEGNLEYKGKFLWLTLFEGGKEENSEKDEDSSRNVEGSGQEAELVEEEN